LLFRSDWTCAEAKKEIRESSCLEGGRLVDSEGFSLRDVDNLGERQLQFVGGKSTGDYLFLSPSHQALNSFLYISSQSHISIA
jgi:hypothetical protein